MPRHSVSKIYSQQRIIQTNDTVLCWIVVRNNSHVTTSEGAELNIRKLPVGLSTNISVYYIGTIPPQEVKFVEFTVVTENAPGGYNHIVFRLDYKIPPGTTVYRAYYDRSIYVAALRGIRPM